MDSSEAELLARLKNTLRDLEEFAVTTETIDELKQRLKNLVVYLEQEQKRSR